jgi:uncharacterized protein YjiS (DUF1127 family)
MSNLFIHGSISSSLTDEIGSSHRSEMSPALGIGLPATIRQWIARARQRRALFEIAELNDHLLKDIGLSKGEALRQAAKWFWQGEERYKIER